MANAYVGNPYALVFPVDCDGFLKIPYGSHTDITETDLWSHGAGFTVEAVITPYDVNGNGETGKGKVQENTGISVGTFTATTSSNTTLSSISSFTGLGIGMPITGTGIPNNTTITDIGTTTITISNAATASASGVTISFGDYANTITNRYAQKMMLFSNTSFQFYLENQTTGNVNQPAEYRLAAKVGSTTLNSPTLIKPVNTLHGYYDVKGFYDGMRTSLTEINTNASLTSSTVITVSQSQIGLLGTGNKIYDSNGVFVDTVSSISNSGTEITLSNAQSSITSTIYKEQPKEALYVNNLYKVSCVLEKSGKLKLFFNNTLVAETAISSFTFDMTNEDCFIGQDGTNISTQFMGELYEIGMKKGVQPSVSIHTLEAGYSDIIFYYRFGDE